MTTTVEVDGKRRDVQILRGVAVFLVLMYHLKMPGFGNGFLGVDVFFVISGFLMASLYGGKTVGEFYAARINRLVPAYATVVIGTLLVSILFVVPVDFGQLAHQALASGLFVANLYFWSISNYFSDAEFFPLLHLWSLAIEAQFYLLVPLLFPVFRRIRWLTTVTLVLSLLLCIAMLEISPKTSFYMLPTRMWEFLLGAQIAWSSGRRVTRLQRRFGKVTGNGALLLLLIAVPLLPIVPNARDYLYGHPSLAALVVTLATAAVIAFGLSERVERSMLGGALAGLGNVSYSLYLVHFPIIVLWNYTPFGGTRLGYASNIGLVAMLLVTAASTFALHRVVERSARFHLPNWPIRAAAVVAVLTAALSLNHLSWRFTDTELRNVFLAWEDRSPYRCGKTFRLLNPTSTVCSLGGERSEHEVLLIGNSHADSIKKAFAEVAAEHGFETLFTTTNPPLASGRHPSAELLDEIDPDTLRAVVFHFSPSAYEDEGYMQRVTAAVNELDRRAVPVYWLAPVPIYDDHVPKHLFEHLTEGRSLRDLSLRKGAHYAESARFRDFAAALDGKIDGVYDPANALCPGNHCRYMSEDFTPYYFDNGHLTNSGAERIKPIFAKLFDELIYRGA